MRSGDFVTIVCTASRPFEHSSMIPTSGSDFRSSRILFLAGVSSSTMIVFICVATDKCEVFLVLSLNDRNWRRRRTPPPLSETSLLIEKLRAFSTQKNKSRSLCSDFQGADRDSSTTCSSVWLQLSYSFFLGFQFISSGLLSGNGESFDCSTFILYNVTSSETALLKSSSASSNARSA
jgi:hypothetical protein